VRTTDKVLAILCADIHLSLRPPRARRKEADWFDAMACSLGELTALANRYEAPILCAGDIFDYWRAEPELINFALNHLPNMYAIPGQHDLPLHNIDLIKRSAFWTMVLAEKIEPIIHKTPILIENDIVVHGFPFGSPILPFEEQSKKYHIALAHDYFWTDVYHFPGAPKEHEASQYRSKIKGYFAVAFGDNHKGFLTKVNNIPVLNCGTLMRRKTDEAEYEPQIGLLCASGQILIHKLKTSHESLLTAKDEAEGVRKMLTAHDLDDFVTGLMELQGKTFDFLEAIEFAMKEKMVDNNVRQIILEALGR